MARLSDSGNIKDKDGYIGVQDADVAMTSTPVAKPYQVKSPLLRECMAEFIGTMVLILFGDGVVAQVVLGENTKGEYININLCWGLGVLFGIHASGGVSGAHLNPAVTTTLAIYGRLEWRKVIPYIIAQVLGAFVGAFIVWAVYCPMFNTIDPEKETTQGVFATYPSAPVSSLRSWVRHYCWEEYSPLATNLTSLPVRTASRPLWLFWWWQSVWRSV